MTWRSLLTALGLAAGLAVLPFMPAKPALAFRLTPIEMEFAPAGRGATQIFRVENDRAEPAAIELRMFARAMEPDGADRLTPADDAFVVYPEQIVLMPGQSQSVRIQYMGEASPRAELAYRLVAEQLPVDLGGGGPQGGQVRLLVRYVASVYVMPEGVRPQAVVSSAKAVAEDGRRLLELVVENTGTSRQILREPVLQLASGGRTVTVEGAGLAALAGENVLAGARRRFLLPWPADLPANPVGGSLTAKLAVVQ